MGGNAFEGLERLTRSDYEGLAQEMLTLLSAQGLCCESLLYYRQKSDFGDMDILVKKPKLSQKMFDQLMAQLKVQDVVYNSDIISFRYQNFQIDLIYVDPELFDSARFYFAYNDLNNLIGRVAHHLGLKFGWDGLTYLIRTESGHRHQKIVLSRDPQAIYAFLGYDYMRWQVGFDTLEEIFDFVSSSPYFNAEIYAYDNLNHENRTRNRKRKTYQLFLDWLSKQEGLNHFVFDQDKSIYLIRIHNAFPQANLLGQLQDYANEVRLFQLRREKFNGHLVTAWTGLTHQSLGEMIAAFKQAIISKDNQYSAFESYLDQHSKQKIEQDFRTFYQDGLKD